MAHDNVVPPYAAAQNLAQNTVAVLPVPDPVYNKQMRAIADTMDDLTHGILADEGTAADHSIAATSGC